MKKLIYFELRKIFSKRLSMVTLIGILLFSALLSFSTYQNKYAFDQNAGEGSGKAAVEIDKEIAAKYEGILTDEKVRQMMSDFAPTSDLHGLNAAYIYQNAMQSAAFSRFSDLNGNWNGLSVSDVFGNEEIKIGYVDGWLSTSRNMVRVFTALAFAVRSACRPHRRRSSPGSCPPQFFGFHSSWHRQSSDPHSPLDFRARCHPSPEISRKRK
ncbi:hypothetical protein [Frisingicoccus sp.]|uniref:hypothetical protein n=1 Tax=Frisingicoccus sp. TaxID=1918627 RepID=UPI003AB65697